MEGSPFSSHRWRAPRPRATPASPLFIFAFFLLRVVGFGECDDFFRGVVRAQTEDPLSTDFSGAGAFALQKKKYASGSTTSSPSSPSSPSRGGDGLSAAVAGAAEAVTPGKVDATEVVAAAVKAVVEEAATTAASCAVEPPVVVKVTVTPPAVCRRRAAASNSTLPLRVSSTFLMATVHMPHAVFVTAVWRAVCSAPTAAVVSLPAASSAEAGSALKTTAAVTGAVASAQASVEGLLLRWLGENGESYRAAVKKRVEQAVARAREGGCARSARGEVRRGGVGAHQPAVLHSKRSLIEPRKG